MNLNLICYVRRIISRETYMKIPVAAVVVLLLLCACGGDLSGKYGGEECLYEEISFQRNGSAELKMMSVRIPARYELKGDYVMLASNEVKLSSTDGALFLRKGDALVVEFENEEIMRCTKL